MLFRRANGERVDANNSAKVVKVLQFLTRLLAAILTEAQYINTKLRVLFELDTLSKPKPITGPNELLLLFVYY